MKKEREAYFLPPLPQSQKRSCFCKTSAWNAIFLGINPLDHRSPNTHQLKKKNKETPQQRDFGPHSAQISALGRAEPEQRAEGWKGGRMDSCRSPCNARELPQQARAVPSGCSAHTAGPSTAATGPFHRKALPTLTSPSWRNGLAVSPLNRGTGMERIPLISHHARPGSQVVSSSILYSNSRCQGKIISQKCWFCSNRSRRTTLLSLWFIKIQATNHLDHEHLERNKTKRCTKVQTTIFSNFFFR